MLESVPKFYVRERVLAVDSRQSGDAVVAEGRERPSPLYEAIVLKSGLKFLDPTSGSIVLPDRKKTSGRSHHHHHNPPHTLRQDLGGAGDGDGGGGGAREWCHLVHFLGWNSRHDRWMREADVFHDNPTNRTRVGTKAPPEQKEGVEGNKTGKKRGRLTKENIVVEDYALGMDIKNPCDKNLQLITRACTLPFTLQTILVDDGDKITKRVYPPPVFYRSDKWTEEKLRGITMLHVIPVKRSIIDVIGEYIRHGKRRDLEAFAKERERLRIEEDRRTAFSEDVTNRDDCKAVMTKDDDQNKNDERSSDYSTTSTKELLRLKKKKRKQFALSIITLFDVSLPLFLLYKEEREQYVKVAGGGDYHARADASSNTNEADTGDTDNEVKEGVYKRPSELYGAEHLLRFLVKLPFIISQYDCKDADSGIILGSCEGNTPVDVFILASEDLSRDFANNIADLVVYLQKHLDCFTREHFPVKIVL
jgi:hypothetical protein